MASSPLVGWQDGDSTRGTFSIVKTCIATIFACTWTIQHLNVPAAHQGELRRLLRVCKWMLITILLPEFILAKAILELALAVRCMREMEKAIKLRDPLKGPNRFYRNGNTAGNPTVEIVYPTFWGLWWRWSAIPSRLGWKKKPDEEQNQKLDRPITTHTWTLTHAYFANMGGFVFTPPIDGLAASSDPEQSASPEPNARPVTGIQLAKALHHFEYPGITEDEIQDKSKTDVLAKIFSVFQISHLMLSLIARRAQGLPSSQLEVLTLAFAVCGVATYAVYWYKPKDVAVPVHVCINEGTLGWVKSGGGANEVLSSNSKAFDSFWKVATNNMDRDHETLGRVPNDNIPISHSGYTHAAMLLLSFVSAVFGSLHAIAWDFDFPTAAEKTAWHVCTILTITLPPLGLLAIPLSQATWRQDSPRHFLHASARVVREFTWQLDNAEDIQAAAYVRYELENIYNSDITDTRSRRPMNQTLYRDVFWPHVALASDGLRFRQKLLDFVDKKEPFQNRPNLHLPPGYAQNLHRLVRLMDGEGSKKMVEGVAKTNVFPRRELPAVLNIGLIYIAMGLYCVARLALVALGLSSLRAMPELAYNSTWADYIPAI